MQWSDAGALGIRCLVSAAAFRSTPPSVMARCQLIGSGPHQEEVLHVGFSGRGNQETNPICCFNDALRRVHPKCLSRMEWLEPP